MGPELPAGREAGAAWRALSPQGRQAAWAAARAGTSPGDLGVGMAAAGHGRRVAGVLRVVLMIAPLLYLLLIVGLGVVAIGYHEGGGLYLTALPVLLVAYLATMLVLRLRLRRYRALYDSGMLAIEAAMTTGVTPTVDPYAWQSSYQSEFTVPYQAPLRVATPPVQPRPPADPVHAGIYVLKLRRTTVALRLVIPLLVGALLWGNLSLIGDASPGMLPMRALLTVIAVGYTVIVLAVLWFNLPLLVRPVLLRLDTAGWTMPYTGMAGQWSGLREIRVRAAGARGGVALNQLRVVVLVVDDPREQLARVSPLRRYLARRAMRRYGSPAVVGASTRTVPAPQLVARLQRYTDAPVTWG